VIATRCLRAGFASLLLSLPLFDCGHPRKQVQVPPLAAPPQTGQSLFVLLPEPDGQPTGISVTNTAGAQTITRPYQAVRVERSGVAPAPPFAMEEGEVRRLFSVVLNALPAAEAIFTLYFFSLGSEVLVPDSQAEIDAIVNAIRERHSTAISLIGHADTTADPQFNYRLGLRRARGVAAILRRRGVAPGDLFVESHGDADLRVKTGRDVAEPLNRRVEVIVR
jgi:outer membrane protein OmpA-like peptidoglycan-associated protein